jgi:hypothetical protein
MPIATRGLEPAAQSHRLFKLMAICRPNRLRTDRLTTKAWTTRPHPALLVDAEARRSILSKSPHPSDRGAYLEMLPYLERMVVGKPI